MCMLWFEEEKGVCLFDLKVTSILHEGLVKVDTNLSLWSVLKLL